MADEQNENYEEEIEYVDENGNPIEYEYEEEAPAEESVEYVDEDGNPIEYDEEAPAEDAAEYVDEDGNPVEYGMDAMDVLPDGVSAAEDAAEGEFGEDGEADEDSDEDEVEKPKSFFGKLGETSPYEVMIWLAFFILLAGVLLMLVKWMSYDMIVYPKYPS